MELTERPHRTTETHLTERKSEKSEENLALCSDVSNNWRLPKRIGIGSSQTPELGDKCAPQNSTALTIKAKVQP